MSQHNGTLEVLRLRDEEELTFDEIGRRLGVSRQTASRRYKAGLLLTIDDIDVDLMDDRNIYIPEIQSDFIAEDRHELERFKPLRTVGDAIVTADWHIPLHDPVMVNAVIETAKETNIKTLIIAGDLVHAETAGSYLPHQPEASQEQEEQDANIIIKTLLRTFDTIKLSWGNHDYRYSRATGYKHSFTECMRHLLRGLSEEELGRLCFSDLDYQEYWPLAGERKIRICHQENFSKVPLTVPKALAHIYGCGVIAAHSHHCAMGVAENGEDLIFEVGGLFHPARTEYIQRTTTNHNWVQGFIYFKDGVPYIKSPKFKNI